MPEQLIYVLWYSTSERFKNDVFIIVVGVFQTNLYINTNRVVAITSDAVDIDIFSTFVST